MLDAVVGREAELSAVGRLLERVADGPAMLVLAGEAGIGKTTVWRYGVRRAQDRGFTTLVCRPVAAEVRLSYAGLADLLAEVHASAFVRLPQPQRRALDAALLRTGDVDPAPDPRAVAAGMLSLLRELAGAMPVLLAIDDVQWLDEPTRRVLEFAVRRCRGPVATLVTLRDDPAALAELRPSEPDRLETVPVGPLSLAALHHVLTQHTGQIWSRPALVRIAQACGGNPFFALELARSSEDHPLGPLVLPDTLRELVRDRLDHSSPSVREALLVASALAAPRVDLVGRALGGDAGSLLGEAEDQGIVMLAGNGVVRFSHPLLATGAYTDATPSARRELHRRLSGVVDDVEERARHLALAALGPDPETIAALDAAADAARRRGAPATGAELRELAIGLGADSPPRRVQAAHDHVHAGDPTRARHLLESAIADLDAGPVRADALALLGQIHYLVEDYATAATLLERALAEAGTDVALRVFTALELGFALVNGGRVAEALPLAETAAKEAEQLADRGLLAEALGAVAIVRFLAGQGVDEVTFARALELEDVDRPSHATRWPALNATMATLWSHRLAEARSGLAGLRRRCLDHGLESDLWFVCYHEADAALRCGDIPTAKRLVTDMAERAALTGAELPRAFALAARAQLQAWIGEVDEARSSAASALATVTEAGMVSGSLFTLGTLGLAELSVGDYEKTAEWLAPAAGQMAAMGLNEPAVVPFLPDAVQALVALNRLDEAEPLVALLEDSGSRRGHAWAEAVGARCRGLVLSAQRRPGDATAAFDRALAAHDRLPELRYDRARTLLVVGECQRRQNQRRAAHTSLAEAARLFAELGAAQWEHAARATLDRIGLHAGAGDELTATEQRVADLAASGMTVRAMAAALLISPKTVEAHLTRIYRKLGIRSRAELGRITADRESGRT
ncbi:MAG: AAA family ATPase [Actinophytocola sp.]|nr:AAA family ATPase [Actinophytocola sp.]